MVVCFDVSCRFHQHQLTTLGNVKKWHCSNVAGNQRHCCDNVQKLKLCKVPKNVFLTLRQYRSSQFFSISWKGTFMGTIDRASNIGGPGWLYPPRPTFLRSKKRKKETKGKKRVSKQKLLKGYRQGENIIALTILERLEFENIFNNREIT